MHLQVQQRGIILLVAMVSLLLSSITITFPWQKGESQSTAETGAEAASKTSEIHGVKVERSPPQSKLDELGVSTWPTWSCGPSKFPWTFKSTEMMYLMEGKVTVHVLARQDDDDKEKEWFEIEGRDLVVFPKGMNIVWEVVEAVNKHYHLDEADDSSIQVQAQAAA